MEARRDRLLHCIEDEQKSDLTVLKMNTDFIELKIDINKIFHWRVRLSLTIKKNPLHCIEDNKSDPASNL